MDEKELRIGNLIKYTDYPNLKDDLLGKVICVTGDDISFMSNCNVAYLEPIKLTEDIVESLGFKICDYMTDDADPIFILNDVTLCCDSWNNPSFFTDDDLEIKSVHQLQNLYFALTGEELDVTNIK